MHLALQPSVLQELCNSLAWEDEGKVLFLVLMAKQVDDVHGGT